jgi:nitrate reductase cytochrome c-type subunit
MTSRDPPATGPWLSLFLLGSAAIAIAALVVAVQRAPPRRQAEPERLAVAVPAAPAESIAAEAQVFRTGAGMTAIAFAARREREAHPRTLTAMRYLRAYPGAPPRIPHELTPDEFRTGGCKSCHGRGGYSRRFHAYVPVTPHPEDGQCLQCHVGVDQVMAVPLVSLDSNRRCHLCHGGGGEPRAVADPSSNWRPTSWPQLAPITPRRTPPPIPHDLQSRGNCLACHAGAAAVAEIRTAHPEWSSCRQCHVVLDPEAGAFTRTALNVGSPAGGWP